LVVADLCTAALAEMRFEPEIVQNVVPIDQLMRVWEPPGASTSSNFTAKRSISRGTSIDALSASASLAPLSAR
jgi:hypothetical protein